MDRFKNILVTASPGHLEPMTLRAAAELATTNNSHLTILDVIPPLPRFRKTVEVEGRVIDVEEALLQDRTERLRQMAAEVHATENAQVLVKIGEPFVEVIRHVLAHDNDLVMVGCCEMANGEAPEFGSGVMHLLRKCPVPVWVMRPTRAHKLRSLALVDPDPGDPVRDGLNDLVMELATSLTAREGAVLHVGHAWSLMGESALRASPYVGLPGEVVDVMIGSAEATHREHIDALVEQYRVAEFGGSVHVVAGDAGKVLPRLAESLDIGLIVMGTVARTGLSGLIMGNTAETILRSVRCSVLAVKPTGFTTPIKPARG